MVDSFFKGILKNGVHFVAVDPHSWGPTQCQTMTHCRHWAPSLFITHGEVNGTWFDLRQRHKIKCKVPALTMAPWVVSIVPSFPSRTINIHNKGPSKDSATFSPEREERTSTKMLFSNQKSGCCQKRFSPNADWVPHSCKPVGTLVTPHARVWSLVQTHDQPDNIGTA